MGTTSEELKKLYKKLGGKDPKVAGFSAPGEILNAINEIPLPTEYELPTVTTEDAGDVLVVNEEGKWDKGEAGGGLPEVTTDDNGEVLTVVNGVWGKAAPVDKNFVVTINGTTHEYENGIKNSDIVSAINDGKNVVLIEQNNVYIYFGTDNVRYWFFNLFYNVLQTKYGIARIGLQDDTGTTYTQADARYITTQ